MNANPNTAAPQAAPAGRRVLDAPVRAFHWLFALCFAGAWLTGDSESWRLVHVTLGYTMAGLLAFRLLWGMMGPKPARLGILARKLRHLPDLRALTDPVRRRAALQWSLSAAVAGMLLVVPMAALSGYAVHQEWGGDWLEEVHELMANLFLALVAAHLGLLAVISGMQRRNLALPMLTGRRPEPGPDLVPRNHLPVALLLVALVSAFWVWQWREQPVGGEQAAAAGLSREDDRDDDD